MRCRVVVPAVETDFWTLIYDEKTCMYHIYICINGLNAFCRRKLSRWISTFWSPRRRILKIIVFIIVWLIRFWTFSWNCRLPPESMVIVLTYWMNNYQTIYEKRQKCFHCGRSKFPHTYPFKTNWNHIEKHMYRKTQ